MPFTVRYTPEQKQALAAAYLDRGIRPSAAVLELAEQGELTLGSEKLPPFTVNPKSFQSLMSDERKRRSGRTRKQIVRIAHIDAVEDLRQRYVAVADHELRKIEDQQGFRGNKGEIDLERLRQVGRLIREAAALPAQKGDRAKTPPKSQATPDADSDNLAARMARAAAIDQTGKPPADTAAEPTTHSKVPAVDAHSDADQQGKAGDDAGDDAHGSADLGADTPISGLMASGVVLVPSHASGR